MSLFQLKDWWSTKIGENEEFDGNHLATGHLNSDIPEENYIIIGSYLGYLRIYNPSEGNFKIEQLLFEKNFECPIIQILVGKFNPTSMNELCVAVLFFKKIEIYSFTFSKNGVQEKKVSQNNLKRNAYRMINGNFGGAKNFQNICIESCDGMLMIYEQDKLSFLVQIDNFILPSPLEYFPVIDSFILQNSCCELESFKYATISTNYSETNNEAIQSDWSLNLGEQAQKIEKFKKNKNVCDLIVLTESMIFIISQNGSINKQKKLEYQASTFIVYNENNKLGHDSATGETIPAIFLIVSSFTHHIMIYKDFELLWAAK